MDSIERFIKLMGQAADNQPPALDVSTAVLRTIRGPEVRLEQVDYVPLAFAAALAIAASVFFLVSLPGALVVDRSMTELVNPISMLVP